MFLYFVNYYINLCYCYNLLGIINLKMITELNIPQCLLPANVLPI